MELMELEKLEAIEKALDRIASALEALNEKLDKAPVLRASIAQTGPRLIG